MPVNKRYSVYILSNKTRLLYVGFSNNLTRRMAEHKNGQIGGYTKKFKLDQLVYFEHYDTLSEAIETEKWLKGMRRDRMVKLIEESNPSWADLNDSLLDESAAMPSRGAKVTVSSKTVTPVREKRSAGKAPFTTWINDEDDEEDVVDEEDLLIEADLDYDDEDRDSDD
ncbi:GIY-YIG nuclease family protein [bacterium]|nr:GIY-YIG nuclease family protein [bacterium]